MKTLDHNHALGLIVEGDNGPVTLREYFHALLSTLWHEEEGFSGKRPFGNSGWQGDVYRPLAKAGYVTGDEDGYVAYGEDRRVAARVVQDLIYFAIHGKPEPKEAP